MENTLTTYFKGLSKEQAEKDIKSKLSSDYHIMDVHICTGPDHFDFVFDDETCGSITISFETHAACLEIEVTGDHPWEVVQVYQMVKGLFTKDEEGGAA